VIETLGWIFLGLVALFWALQLLRLPFLQPIVRWEVKKWCRDNNMQFVGVRIVSSARMEFKINAAPVPAKIGQVILEYRRPGSPKPQIMSVVWHAAWYPKLVFTDPDREFKRVETSPEELAAQAYEREVRFETTRRLNAITSRTGWAAEHDLDGSGKIEPDEWEALKKKIEAEVRAEKSEVPGEFVVHEESEESQSVW